MSAESDSSFSPDHEPTRALLLAQALEACIQAERRVPGSADHVIARQPAWARAELRRLVTLAEALDAAAASAVMADDFRFAARARLMRRIAPDYVETYPHAAGQNGHLTTGGVWLTSIPSRNGYHTVGPRRPRWVLRTGLGGLLAATLVLGATLTASANALPGEPLYSVKQAREELGIRFAPTDDARALALLDQANARLDETARLLEQGRTDQVAQTAERFDDSLAQATTTYVVTIADAAPSDSTPNTMQSKLSHQQDQLETMLASAPEPARADLRQALVATERSRALVTEPKPVDRRGGRPSSVAAAPTTAAEVLPTKVPVASVPPPVDLVAQRTPAPIAENDDRHEGRNARNTPSDDQHQQIELPTAVVARGASPPVVTTRPANVVTTPRRDGRLEDVRAAPGPVVVVEDDGGDRDVNARQSDQPGGGVTVSGQPVDRKSDGDDRVVAPSPNQDDARERVAQQPPRPTSAVVAQRQSGGGGGSDGHGDDTARASTPAPAVAQTSAPNTGRTTSSRDGGDGDGGDSPRIQATPVPTTTRSQPTLAPSTATANSGTSTANSPTTSTTSGDRHGGGDGDTTTTTTQTARSTSGQTSTTQTSTSNTTTSSTSGGGGDRDGGGHGH